MKISETIAAIYKDMENVDDGEPVSITFAGITWTMKISSIKKIIEYANKYFESKKA